MNKIGIFVGTVYGNSLLVAQQAKKILELSGYKVSLYEEYKNYILNDFKNNEKRNMLIITSTTGQGDLPDNIVPLFQTISYCDDQSNLNYGLIGLGDSCYPDFCAGGKKFDVLLKKKHANRIGEMLFIDAETHPVPEEISSPWIKNWITFFNKN